MRLSVVIPCFNEEGNISQVVRQTLEVGRSLASELEIIVVDDGSTDDTAGVLDALRRDVPELQIVTHLRNRGYGAAVRAGLRLASMETVFLTDGDGQFDLHDLPRAAQLLREHDLVAGYRARRSDGWWRVLWGRLWTALVNRVFGLRVRDANCAFKLIPQSLLRSAELQADGALISAELLSEARRLELSVGQCAVRHYPRLSGRQTGVSPRVIGRALAELAGSIARERKTPSSSREYAP